VTPSEAVGCPLISETAVFRKVVMGAKCFVTECRC